MVALILLTLGVLAAPAWCAQDAGAAKTAAAYLDFSLGARAVAMGQGHAAVVPEDVTGLHENPATLALLSGHSAATTTGLLGVDRRLLFAGYALPLRQWRESMELDASKLTTQKPTLWKEKRESPSWVLPVQHMDFTLAAGMTYFTIGDIEGRSDYGALEADFQDAEKTFYLSGSMRPFENLALGFTGKRLTQTLESASADGWGFDAGMWYRLPWRKSGTWDFAIVARDLGSDLGWEINDPILNQTITYEEPVLSRYVSGLAYTSPGGRWLVIADAVKVQEQQWRLHNGIEWA